jgi:hypothetical protein
LSETAENVNPTSTPNNRDILMGTPRVFVGFSSNDIRSYRLMLAWKAHEHINFDFVDCQLQSEINSENEYYIKRKCRERILMSSTFIQLIGEDTRHKHKYVRWEAEVALEKKCKIICVNLNGSRVVDDLCPTILRNTGSVFVPFSAAIVAHAIQTHQQHQNQDWHYIPEVYRQLGYPI